MATIDYKKYQSELENIFRNLQAGRADWPPISRLARKVSATPVTFEGVGFPSELSIKPAPRILEQFNATLMSLPPTIDREVFQMTIRAYALVLIIKKNKAFQGCPIGALKIQFGITLKALRTLNQKANLPRFEDVLSIMFAKERDEGICLSNKELSYFLTDPQQFNNLQNRTVGLFYPALRRSGNEGLVIQFINDDGEFVEKVWSAGMFRKRISEQQIFQKVHRKAAKNRKRKSSP